MPLPEDMNPQMMVWHFFAATYGWTPDQVENAPLEIQTWFPLINKALHEAQEKLSKQDARARR